MTDDTTTHHVHDFKVDPDDPTKAYGMLRPNGLCDICDNARAPTIKFDDDYQELLDAREVVETADDFLSVIKDQRSGLRLLRDVDICVLESALDKYWRKWGDK